jgi:hypothetical protein
METMFQFKVRDFNPEKMTATFSYKEKSAKTWNNIQATVGHEVVDLFDVNPAILKTVVYESTMTSPEFKDMPLKLLKFMKSETVNGSIVLKESQEKETPFKIVRVDSTYVKFSKRVFSRYGRASTETYYNHRRIAPEAFIRIQEVLI